jgi:hypothetical protein
MKVPIGGGTPITLAAGQSSPGGIVVSGTTVFWTIFLPPSSGAVRSVGIGGSPYTTLAASAAPVGPLATDGTSLYWSASTVVKVGIAGGTPISIPSGAGTQPGAIAVDATSVYWADSFLGLLKAAK